jgi:hypothetical protein
MTCHAQSAGLKSPHTVYAFPDYDQPCRPMVEATSGPAPIIAPMPKPAATAQSEFRASILAAMRERRAQLIDRARTAKAAGKRKALWTCEAEIASLTNGLLFMEGRA